MIEINLTNFIWGLLVSSALGTTYLASKGKRTPQEDALLLLFMYFSVACIASFISAQLGFLK